MKLFCHACGTQAIDDTSSFCNNCGTPLIPYLREKAVTCATCGAHIPDKDSVFCVHCGSLVSPNGSHVPAGSPGAGSTAPAQGAARSKSQKPLGRKPMVLPALLIFIAFVLTLLVLSQSGIVNPLSSPSSTTAYQEPGINPVNETPAQMATPMSTQIPFSTRNKTSFAANIAPTAATTIVTSPVSSTPTPTETIVTFTQQSTRKNIVETADADGRFTTFVAAVKAAGLDDTLRSDTLSGSEMFTVFAPTDDAFNTLSPGSMDTLLKDPTADLLQILLYHVVGGKVTAADLKKRTSIETLQGGNLTISASSGGITVEGANVIVTDIECTNGVIHGVDTVMLPPA